ncbi:transcription elongation factor [gamma proteobacterium HTCC5015]|nr:transcription elongation factor [gamma proteobacterium HTCC5015]
MVYTHPPITLPELDVARIESLLEKLDLKAKNNHTELFEELYRCRIVSSQEVSPDVVTMNSRVKYTRLDTQQQSTLTLCYPDQISRADDAVSILAPIGSAIIGLSVGQIIDWPLPNGKNAPLRIDELLFQPERSGNYTL